MRLVLWFATFAITAIGLVGCSHGRARIWSSRDIRWTSSSEYLIEVKDLPLKDWPKLRKFKKLSDLSISATVEPSEVDDYLVTLSQLNIPKLSALRFECSPTDRGLHTLTNLPYIICLDLYGPYITDDGVHVLAKGMPQLNSLSFTRCASITVDGYLSLTNSPTLRAVLLSVEDLNQGQLEHIMAEVGQVTYWGFDMPTWELSLEPLKKLKDQRGLTIVISDKLGNRSIDQIMESD